MVGPPPICQPHLARQSSVCQKGSTPIGSMAMAAALPVVTTDVGGVRELVADRTGAAAGAIVVPREPAALAAALEHYLTAPDAARAAGARNRAKAIADFSWRASALRLLDVYR